MTESTDRRHPSRFFNPDQVPEFDGDSALFEIETQGRAAWVVRLVEP